LNSKAVDIATISRTPEPVNTYQMCYPNNILKKTKCSCVQIDDQTHIAPFEGQSPR